MKKIDQIWRLKIRVGLMLTLLAGLSSNLSAQKKVLDFDAIKKWPTEFQINELSKDGRYITYYYHQDIQQASVLESLDYSWRLSLKDVGKSNFTNDSKYLIFKRSDTLGILDLRSKQFLYIPRVTAYKMPLNGSGKWMAYSTQENELILRDLSSGNERPFTGAGKNDYWFSDNGETFVFQKNTVKELGSEIDAVDLNRNTIKILAHGANVRGVIFDHSNQKCAFFSREQGKMLIRYFTGAMDSAKILVSAATTGMEGMQLYNNSLSFSSDGEKLFFQLMKPLKKVYAVPLKGNFTMTIRDYKYEQALHEIDYGRYLGFIALNDPDKVVRMTNQDYTSPVLLDPLRGASSDGRYVLVCHSINKDQLGPKDIFLANTTNFSKILIRQDVALDCYSLTFSPDNKYVLWFDTKIKQWYSYGISKKQIRCITMGIGSPLDWETDQLDEDGKPEGIAGFLEKSNNVLIYDRNAIWEVDMEKNLPPVKLTKTEKQDEKIRFRIQKFKIVNPSGGILQNRYPVYKTNDALILSAFNTATKENGFFKLSLGYHSHLQRLTMGKDLYLNPFDIRFSTNIVDPELLIKPVKALDTNVFVLQKTNTNKFPNFVITSNFERFRQITEFEPQKNYNWYTTDLIHYCLPDGHKMEAILYKPEDFDPKKKYPVLFYYYERNADALNAYIDPALMGGPLNIPWYVSNGYLVVVPDIIYYKHGYPGNCAASAVISAAKCVAKFPFVDSHRMGIQGHSYGGYETNYILTKTRLFAAACEAEGVSDIISSNSQNRQYANYCETGQGRMYTTFWKKPERYLENSPLLHADRVATPLLIMHNHDDFTVYFDQGEEWYNSLVLLGKKVWMLSYDDSGGHELTREDAEMDYSTRMTQFFDYYLKGALPPKWMTNGEDVTGDGKKIGYELNTSYKRP